MQPTNNVWEHDEETAIYFSRKWMSPGVTGIKLMKEVRLLTMRKETLMSFMGRRCLSHKKRHKKAVATPFLPWVFGTDMCFPSLFTRRVLSVLLPLHLLRRDLYKRMHIFFRVYKKVYLLLPNSVGRIPSSLQCLPCCSSKRRLWILLTSLSMF